MSEYFSRDAKGILHKALESSFSQAMDTGHFPKVEKFASSFKQFKSTLSAELGLNLDNGIILEDIGSQIKNFLASAAVRTGVETAVSFAATALIGLEGPAGIILSEAITVAGGELIHYLAAGSGAFKRGDWVILDLGVRSKILNQIPRVIELTSGFMGFTKVPDEVDYLPEAKHTFGFFIEKTPEGDVLVFSFEDGGEHQLTPERVKLCPDSLKSKIEDDAAFSKLRDAYFEDLVDPLLHVDVPTATGSTVFYKNREVKIVEVEFPEYIVETADGLQLQVTQDDLTAGKSEGTSSYNPKTTHLGSFQSIENGRLFSGQWIWMPASDVFDKIEGRRSLAALQEVDYPGPESKVLGLIESVSGSEITVYRAYDGKGQRTAKTELVLASDGIQRTLNSNIIMKRWKGRVMNDQDPEENPPGEEKPYLALGFGNQAEIKFELESGMDPTEVKRTDVAMVSTTLEKDSLIQRQYADVLDEEEARMRVEKDVRRYAPAYDNSEYDKGFLDSGFTPVLLIAVAVGIFAVLS
jgi:hypothetical protein